MFKQVALQDNSSPLFKKMMGSWADNYGEPRTTGLCEDLVIMNKRVSSWNRTVCIWRAVVCLVTFSPPSRVPTRAFTLSGLFGE